jgi:hypothetical protein
LSSWVSDTQLTPFLSCSCLVVNFVLQAGMRFALFWSNDVYKIGFPGWPNPNLDWDFGFGGSVIRKRGLAPAPFFVLGLCRSKWLVRGSRGWSCLSPVGRKTSRPFVLPRSQSIFRGSQIKVPDYRSSHFLGFAPCERHLSVSSADYCRKWASNQAKVRAITSRWCLGLAKRWPSRS